MALAEKAARPSTYLINMLKLYKRNRRAYYKFDKEREERAEEARARATARKAARLAALEEKKKLT